MACISVCFGSILDSQTNNKELKESVQVISADRSNGNGCVLQLNATVAANSLLSIAPRASQVKMMWA